MDLHLIPGAEPSAAERAAVDAVIGAPASGWEGGTRRPDLDGHVATGGDAIRARRHLLLPALWAAQTHVGWISPGALNYICQRLAVAPAEVYGVATFYAMLSVEPQPATVVHVCDDLACRLAGGRELLERARRETGGSGAAAVRPSPCLGLCERAPAVLYQRAGEGARDEAVAPAAEIRAGASPAPTVPVGAALAAARSGSPSAPQTQDARREGLRLLRRIGHVNPESLDDYRGNGGYRALPRAFEMGPDAVIREALESKLQGRGGAAFPAGRKWEAVARQPARPHYLVCNADESEPGTFKDRVLLEEDPFAVVEAMTIVGFATGCEKGYLYIRGEYPLALERVIATRSTRRGQAASSATGSSDRPTDSTSRCGAAPARTSAARRRRSSTRSRASAASRGTSRRFPSRRGFSASPRSSTTSRRSPT